MALNSWVRKISVVIVIVIIPTRRVKVIIIKKELMMDIDLLSGPSKSLAHPVLGSLRFRKMYLPTVLVPPAYMVSFESVFYLGR